MKIEIGKFYRTRDGRKVLALALNPFVEKGSDFELITVTEDGGTIDYVADGMFLNSNQESEIDLIEEWNEPEDAPLEFGDIEFGTAFKLASRKELNVATYITSVSDSGITLGSNAVNFARLKSDFLMQLPGTKEWVPCSKKSISL